MIKRIILFFQYLGMFVTSGVMNTPILIPTHQVYQNIKQFHLSSKDGNLVIKKVVIGVNSMMCRVKILFTAH